MEADPQLLDVGALTVDLPELQLRRGQCGTVVDILRSGRALEVEFSNQEGRQHASVGIRPDQVEVLHHPGVR